MTDIDDLLARLEAEDCDRGRYDREAAAVIRELMGVQMSACYQCGAQYPSAPAGHIHKFGNDPDVFLKSLGICNWEIYRPQAVAAIAAMPGGGPGAWVPADHLAEANREIARLRELVEMSEIWLNAALGCKDWVWDVDQHEAATETLRDLRAAIKENQP